MKKQKRVLLHVLVAFIFAAGIISAASQTVRADDPEFDSITKHLKLHYNAKRIHIPFLGLANFFVHIIKPAGVKSFKVAIFEGLNFTSGNADTELGQVMRSALSADWQPVVRANADLISYFPATARWQGLVTRAYWPSRKRRVCQAFLFSFRHNPRLAHPTFSNDAKHPETHSLLRLRDRVD